MEDGTLMRDAPGPGSAEHRGGEVVEADDLLDRRPRELLREALGRVTDRDVACGQEAVGDVQQLAHLRLLVAEQGGHGAAYSLVAERQAEVLHGGVDRA